MPDKPDLAALLGSRICHDLISPIGAISNGVELMMMDGSVRGPEMALVVESVAAANARIKFFRVGFGAASPDQRIGRSEVTGILTELLRGRLSVEWQSPADLSRREVKLVFLLIQCLESAMPFGGRITVDLDEGRWQISANSARLRVDPDLWEALSNPAAHPDTGPAQVHFLLAAAELHGQGHRLTADIREMDIRLSF